ncbi:MAG: DUF58 domain-containing protein [Firmicutes bacterium]|nr:DUF58 domain-containing protein [Bacillota bacterium]
MFLSYRAILYAGVGILFILVFSRLLTPVGAALVFNAALLVIALIDYMLTPSLKNLRFTRIMEDKLSLGTDNRVAVEISNLSGFRVKIQVKDDYPDSFEVDKKMLELSLKGQSGSEVHYSVKPPRRGAYTFGHLHVRVNSILGLLGRQFKVDLTRMIKVYPNIKEISRYKIIARKGRLIEAGLKPVRAYGMGTEFESLREYLPDDEFRKISWKATARKGKIVASQYQNERSQNIFIAIDSGRMMTSRVNGISKLDYAMNAALLLGYVAMEKGDNVGMMVFSDDIKTFVPCKRGKKQLHLLIESLYNQEPTLVEPDYGRAIRYLSTKNRKRSLVVIFTDLIDTDVSRAIVTYSRSLYPTHLPLVVAINDPALYAEADKPAADVTEVYHRAVAEDLIAQREQVKAALHKGGVMTLDVPPSKLTPSLVEKYLSVKARARL